MFARYIIILFFVMMKTLFFILKTLRGSTADLILDRKSDVGDYYTKFCSMLKFVEKEADKEDY